MPLDIVAGSIHKFSLGVSSMNNLLGVFTSSYELPTVSTKLSEFYIRLSK